MTGAERANDADDRIAAIEERLDDLERESREGRERVDRLLKKLRADDES